jgi:GNAT superfamily N-acetyltransferase
VTLKIAPLEDRHLEEAAELLAARHRVHRADEPELPALLEDPTAAAAALERLLGREHSNGAVAHEGERMAGFVIGIALQLPPGSSSLATVPFEGMAVDREGGDDVYRELYAAIAPGWVDASCLAHFVSVMASDATAVDAWFSLGFGQNTITAVRDTSSAATSAPPDIDIRRGEPGDIDAIVRLEDELRSYQTGSPVFLPYPQDRRAGMPGLHRRLLADESIAYWLALRRGRAVAYQLFAPVPDGVAHLPESCVYIEHASTEEAERGAGVGTALLQRGLAWARESGYDRCATDWAAPNLLAGRFWLHNGFRPTSYGLCRRLGEHVTGDLEGGLAQRPTSGSPT